MKKLNRKCLFGVDAKGAENLIKAMSKLGISADQAALNFRSASKYFSRTHFSNPRYDKSKNRI